MVKREGTLKSNFKIQGRDFPGSPVMKTLGFQCRGCRFDPWARRYDPTCLKAKTPKHKNSSNIVTNSIKTLKMVHSKKKKKSLKK